MAKKKNKVKPSEAPLVTSVADALKIYEKYDFNVKKFKILLCIALVLPVIFIALQATKLASKAIVVYPIAVLIFYIVAGVFSKVLKSVFGTAKKIAFWGWFLIPIFPIDLVIGLWALLAAVVYAVFALLILPAIPMYSKWKGLKTEYKAAIDLLYENGFVDANGNRIDESDDDDEREDGYDVPSRYPEPTAAENPKPVVVSNSDEFRKLEPSQSETPKKSSLKVLEHTKKKCPNCGQATLNIVTNGTAKVYLCPSCKKKYKCNS